ncbi:MAG: tetratricopeptide (TPR) repeat protein [Myxococcota bacterium]|jgi:tetratricopeptide (TPR) repeat protein
MFDEGNRDHLGAGTLVLAAMVCLVGWGVIGPPSSAADRVKNAATMELYDAARLEVATATRIGADTTEGRRTLKAARDKLLKALGKAPGFEQAAILLGETLLKLGEHRTAIEPLEKALIATLDSVPLQHLLGVHLFRLDRFREGAPLLEMVARAEPDRFDVSYLLAGHFYRTRRLRKAERHAANYLRLKPDDAAIHGLIGNVHLLAGRRDQAISAFQNVLRLDPQNITVRVNLGNVLYQLKRFDKAIEIYTYVHRKRPDLALVQYNLGSCYYALKKWQDAREHFEGFLKLEPNHAQGHYFAGSALANLGKVRLAISRLARATLLDPADPWAPFALARLALGLGDLSTAESYIQTALARKTDEVDILLAAGLISRARQRFPEAVGRLEHAVLLASTRADVRAELGFARILSGQLDAGIDDLEGARALKPSSRRVLGWLPVARTRRAIRHLTAGRLAEAEADLKRALEVAPTLIDAAWNLGLLYDGQDRADEAIPILRATQRALQAADSSARPEPNLQLLTAFLMVRVGKIDEAQSELADAKGAQDAGLRWLVQGVVHGRFGEYDAAIAAFERAAEQGLDAAAALGFARLDKAAALLAAGRIPDALNSLNALRPQLAPEQARLQAALTIVGLLQQDRDFVAIERLLPIIGGGKIPKGWGLERLGADLDLLSGYVKYRTGDEIGALAALESHTRVHPDDPRGRRLMAVLLGDLAERDHSARRFQRAQARAARAVEFSSDDGRLQHNLGCVLYAMGKHVEAAKIFKTLSTANNVPEATLNLALYYDDVANRGAEAVALYQTYVAGPGLATELARRRLARKERIFGSP